MMESTSSTSSAWPPRIDLPSAAADELRRRFGSLSAEDLGTATAQAELADEASLTVAGLARVQKELGDAVHGCGAAIVTGVPFDDGPLIALSSRLGFATDEQNGYPGRTVWDIREVPDAKYTRSTDTDPFDLHTDSTYSVRPHEVIGMVCAKPAPDGTGVSLLFSAELVASTLRDTGRESELARLGMNDFPYFALGVPEGTPPFQGPVLDVSGKRARVRYRYDMLCSSLDQLAEQGAPEAEVRGARAAVEAMQDVLSNSGLATTMLLRSGDYLVVDNTRVLHGRTAVTGSSDRHLRRLKIFADAYQPV